jgi:hypothetical protein
MWPPPSIQALPSKEEILQTKEEISFIELQLIEVQLKMEALQKSIAERKAWIAPIRKLPHDVLSQIFVEVSMDNWKAPLILQSVSRWWRDVVVGTPRAWTFIPLFECDVESRSDLVSIFIERGRNVALHLFAANHHCFPQMKMLASRIECMYLHMAFNSMKYFIPDEYDFTRLERLYLRADTWSLSLSDLMFPSAWDMMQFPNPKSLELAVCGPLLLAIMASPEFPSIRWLKVECEDPSLLAEILPKCAKSLESIDLSYGAFPSTFPDIMPTIHLPCLRYMRLEDTASETERHWCINGLTPNLEAYSVVGNQRTIEHFTLDLCNVTLLSVIRAPDLSLYPRIITLYIGGRDKVLLEVINSLWRSPQSSPDLAVIEYETYLPIRTLEEAKTSLLALAEATGRWVKLEQVDWRMLKERAIHQGWMPQPVRHFSIGILASLMMPLQCSRHMPCHSDVARRLDHF